MRTHRPRSIVLFAFEGANVLDITGPLQLFSAVNDELPKDRPGYTLTLAARSSGPFTTSSGLKLVADAPYAKPAKIDTLIISGGEGTRAALQDKILLAAIAKHAPTARRIASVCTGAFLLAAAGLLKNKRATTHWSAAAQLAKHFPDTKVEPDAIFIQHGKIWTSAGVTAGMDLALALIRADFGDDMALTIARRHVLFMMRPGGQSQFSGHLAPEAWPQTRLAPLLRWIPENISADLDIAALAARANMSERTFARLFARETGHTPAHYVEQVRLDCARRLLTGSAQPIAAVAARSGFGSEERMRRVFQRHLKISPSDFRMRFCTPGEQP
ncbi:MAG TPA: helix-turn-helix domain-containing protein [Rhizomicrobium sp.]|nr:helix-turn-helix domain-containing protein [Rhizomicrobium sp.]